VLLSLCYAVFGWMVQLAILPKLASALEATKNVVIAGFRNSSRQTLPLRLRWRSRRAIAHMATKMVPTPPWAWAGLSPATMTDLSRRTVTRVLPSANPGLVALRSRRLGDHPATLEGRRFCRLPGGVSRSFCPSPAHLPQVCPAGDSLRLQRSVHHVFGTFLDPHRNAHVRNAVPQAFSRTE
jgi:hypothetical protein